MRKTWSTMISLVKDGLVTHLSFNDLSNSQIEAVVSPSPPTPKPSIMPAGNWMKVSVWTTQMHRIRFNHSRGIQVLAEFCHDVRLASDGVKQVDLNVEMIRKRTGGRSARQILTLWALQTGLVVFPDMRDVTQKAAPTTAEDYDKWRVNLMDNVEELALLLSPLFKKRPMWKEAFEIEEKEMELLDGLDVRWNERLNEKLMSSAPKWGSKEKKAKDEKEGVGWEGEYEEYFKGKQELEAKESKVKEKIQLEVSRNVETVARVKIQGESFDLQGGDTIDFNPRKLAVKTRVEGDEGVTMRRSPLKEKSPEKVKAEEKGELSEMSGEEEELEASLQHSALNQFFTDQIKIL